MPITKEDIEGLEWTGRPFGGIIDDIKRRIPYYKSDFTDGLNTKTIGTTIFLFFAALANAIAFGALTGVLTGNEIGVIEMLVVPAAGGIFFALFSGQPLTILGGTGPITIFTGLLYVTCSQLEISFLATYAWVGIWSGILPRPPVQLPMFCLGLVMMLSGQQPALVDGSHLIRHLAD